MLNPIGIPTKCSTWNPEEPIPFLVFALSICFLLLGPGCSGSSQPPVLPLPPPPPPTGQTVFFQEGFEDGNFSQRGFYDNTSLSLSTGEKHSGNSSVQYRFTPGATKPINGSAFRHKFAETESVYLSYWIKYSSNWTGSNKPYHPHQFHFLTNKNADFSGLSDTFLTTYVEENDGIPILTLQDSKSINQAQVNANLVNLSENRSVGGCNGTFGDIGNIQCFDSGAPHGYFWNYNEFRAPGNRAWLQNAAGPRGENDWHHIEAVFKLNSIVNGKAVADGLAQCWYNGQSVIDKRSVLFRTAAQADMKFSQFIIAPYIGDGSPIDQTFWVDDLVVGNAGGTTALGAWLHESYVPAVPEVGLPNIAGR
jgi:hypothetical protein